MNQYEAMFLFDPTFGSTLEKCEEEIRRLMDRAEGEIILCKKWDERRLAYKIKGRKRGVYVIVYFKAPPGNIVKLERDSQLSENVLRVLVLRAEGLSVENMEKASQSGGSGRASAVSDAAQSKVKSEPKLDKDGKPTTGENSDAKPKADGEAKPSADGEAKPSADGEAKPSADDEAKAGADGEPKLGADSEPKLGADSEPKLGADGEPKLGADSEPKLDKAAADGDGPKDSTTESSEQSVSADKPDDEQPAVADSTAGE